MYFSKLSELYLCNKIVVPHADDNRIGPCRVQQRRRSRAQQEQQEIQGPSTPDYEARPWEYLITCPHSGR
jgi:hypothetical protein